MAAFHPMTQILRMTSPEQLLERIRIATADEYEIEREIGRGGMAAVFLSRDVALQRRVAIKVMLPDLINVQGLQDRFVIEARTAAHLDHPGIVTVYAVRQRAGLLFIVMKYIEGHTLEAVLRSQGQIDPVATALIGSRVAEALSFAHGEGVVHRDVKPSNIMIDPRGRPVVTDFGIARVMTAQSITVAGSMLGTPTHMSPEQCRGLPATAASDQYSLGVTIYEMLTGRAPFTGDLFELITAHREKAPSPLSDFVAGVDPSLEQTVMRMLAKDPGDRWASMNEVAQRLSSQTTMHRGDENLRATLVLSDGGSSFSTPERGAAPADVLTPPGSVSPLPLPPASGSPADRASPAVATVETPASEGEVPDAKRGGSRLLWATAVVLVAIISAAVYRGGMSGARVARSSPRRDSVPTATAAASAQLPATRPPGTAKDSATRDSIARDSVARVVAARDSATRDSAARAAAVSDSAAKVAARRDSLAKDSVARVAAAKSSAKLAARKDSAKTSRVRPESLTVQCARLLERASLGEKLTDAERQLLSARCPKK
jgi:serine/threonine-protein kinase